MSRKLTTEEYMSCMDKTPVACIDIVLFNEDRTQVLLFKRTNEPSQGIYFTPGGCIQKGETFAEAATRKMKEELGITLRSEELTKPRVIEELWPNSAFPNISYHAITIFFGYTLTKEEANTSMVQRRRPKHSPLHTKTNTQDSLNTQTSTRLPKNRHGSSVPFVVAVFMYKYLHIPPDGRSALHGERHVVRCIFRE